MQNRNILLITSVAAAVMAAPAFAGTPYLQPDDTWISIDGEVEKVTADAFTLDYGQGAITVEMDDRDRDAEAYKLLSGDKVTVTGFIDDDFYEVAKIEAASVFVESLGTYFYASSVDEEDAIVTVHPVVVSETTLQGEITSVNEAEKQFTVNSGPVQLTVEVDEMEYDPLDESGYQQLAEGDVVSVTGKLDSELFEGRVFDAESVTTLRAEEQA